MGHGARGMKLIDTITIDQNRGSICLYLGDLSKIPTDEKVDVLVLSAFPGDYTPTRNSLVGALDRKGISVWDLARNKQVNLLDFAKCWLSHPLPAGAGFGRLLCYEPAKQTEAVRHICGIFSSVFPIACGDPSISTLALPLVTAGNMGQYPAVVLREIVDQAVYWLGKGLTIKTIKIVIYDQLNQGIIEYLTAEFSSAKKIHSEIKLDINLKPEWDLFLSFSSTDRSIAMDLKREIHSIDSKIKIFDYQDYTTPAISIGTNWMQKIESDIGKSQKFVCLLSPNYFNSQNCMFELNTGYMHKKLRQDAFLLPCYLGQVDLPEYIRAIQYIDIRDQGKKSISMAAGRIASTLVELDKPFVTNESTLF